MLITVRHLLPLDARSRLYFNRMRSGNPGPVALDDLVWS